jgi:glycosyltransferase involved in cell wall biosynthesis
LRILQIHTHYREPGGEDAVVRAERDLLHTAGHDVVAWRRRNPDGAVAASLSLLAAPWNPAQARRVGHAAGAAAADAVHVHNLWFATSPAALRAVRRATDAPLVMTLHNYRVACANGLLQRDGAPCELCVGASPWPAVRYRCYRESRPKSAIAAATIALNRRLDTWGGNVDRFLALTEFARGRMVAAGLPSDKVIVKPNFVPDPGPRPHPASDSGDVLFVGRLSREKGIATLLEGWRRAAPPGLRLIVAGGGPLESDLRADCPPGVELRGAVPPDEVRRLMLSSRALLFPSEWYEGMPMTLLEAFAAGLPAMASDLGAMHEIVAPLGADWLVAGPGPDAWGAALGRVQDGSAVDRAGGVARELWETRYSPARNLELLLDAYRPVR